jgi:hypothetical protein
MNKETKLRIHNMTAKAALKFEKTEAQSIVKEIKQYQNKWLQHVQRMDTNRIRN